MRQLVNASSQCSTKQVSVERVSSMASSISSCTRTRAQVPGHLVDIEVLYVDVCTTIDVWTLLLSRISS